MDEMEMLYFEIITNVGDARSSFIQAISAAKKGDFAEAEELILAGEKSFVKGHHKHSELLQKEAAGEQVPFSLMLLHVEDQLMSAETFKILSKEFIDVYRALGNNATS